MLEERKKNHLELDLDPQTPPQVIAPSLPCHLRGTHIIIIIIIVVVTDQALLGYE
ncbi:hypothetical protein LZ31DRAFT_556287 [Colletotrichum somersetense]|nr:hypothetical protein LZ31DRAFT_556287 [Colletotrichum somersetense]